jgi:EAL domain-containing protein (putative c-di-GMP-specific phosphodiesterase class I)
VPGSLDASALSLRAAPRTGHSSLARLKQLPVDMLKIDKGFVLHMDDEQDAAIVEAAVTLARRLDHTVVAEGVGSATSLRRLRELGCDLAQGFLFARPLPADDLREVLANGFGDLVAGSSAAA